MFSMDDRIQRNEKMPWRIIEKEAVLVNIDKGDVIHLNEVAAQIWNVLDGTKNVALMIDHICNKFDVERSIAERDVLNLLAELIEKEAARLL